MVNWETFLDRVKEVHGRRYGYSLVVWDNMSTKVNYHAHKGRGLSLPQQGHCVSQCQATRMGH